MSGDQYSIKDNALTYFVTFTVVDWVDIFTRATYRHDLVDSLNHCIKQKGLIVHAWVIMSNHMHLIISGQDEVNLPTIIRDYKKYTAKKIYKKLDDAEESRGVWIKKKLEFAANRIARNKEFKLWQDGYFALPVLSHQDAEIKLNYVHNNPVKAEIVYSPEDYLYSSARDYAGEKGLIEIEFLV
jgi:putative transposase